MSCIGRGEIGWDSFSMINPNIPRQSNEPAYLRSETLRYLKEEENRPKGNLSDHPNPNGLPVCYICSRPIL
ncbi:hypothetical protein ANCCEY_13689 [Ancylostoma ceylanicum]|nr:hypothetical protein ANCCEY_13689 [Ancylostoma ceylanicum]